MWEYYNWEGKHFPTLYLNRSVYTILKIKACAGFQRFNTFTSFFKYVHGYTSPHRNSVIPSYTCQVLSIV